jgi:hypothetical protein
MNRRSLFAGALALGALLVTAAGAMFASGAPAKPAGERGGAACCAPCETCCPDGCPLGCCTAKEKPAAQPSNACCPEVPHCCEK